MKKNKLLINYIYNALYQILLMILPLITSPYISRVLGAENIGIYSYTYSVVFYFGIFASLGINHYGNRAIAKCKDKKEREERFSSIFLLHLALSLIILIIYVGYVLLFVNESKNIALIQGLYLLSVLCDISWFFFGLEEFKLTVGRNIVIKLITTLLIFVLVNKTEDLWLYTLIMNLGMIFGNLYLWFILPKYVKLKKADFKAIISHLKPMAVLAISVLAVSVYLYISKIMLGKMSSMEQLGYYENAFKLIQFPIGLVTAMGTVMLPHISNLLAKDGIGKVKIYIENSMKIVSLSAPAIAFGLASVSNIFSVVFWGDDFAACGPILSILSITAVLISWNNIIRTEFLIPMEMDKYYVWAVCAGAVANVLLNLFFIPIFDAIGAAIGTVGAYLTVFLVQNWAVRKDLKIMKYFRTLLLYCSASLVMYIAVSLLKSVVATDLVGLIILIAAGIVIYSIFALILIVVVKDSFFMDYVNKFTSKIKMLKNTK